MRGMLIGVLWLSLIAARSVLAAGAAELQLKSAFIARFTQFIDWPEDAVAKSSFDICVLGENPIEGELGKLSQLVNVQSRPVKVHRVAHIQKAHFCQILFVPAAGAEALKTGVSALANSPVLVVGESPGLAKQGAAINFFVDGDKLRFEINPETAQEAGLKISARLLKLATIVE